MYIKNAVWLKVAYTKQNIYIANFIKRKKEETMLIGNINNQ